MYQSTVLFTAFLPARNKQSEKKILLSCKLKTIYFSLH